MIWLKTPCIESGLVKQENIRVALIYLLVSLIQSNPKRSNINHTLLSFFPTESSGRNRFSIFG